MSVDDWTDAESELYDRAFPLAMDATHPRSDELLACLLELRRAHEFSVRGESRELGFERLRRLLDGDEKGSLVTAPPPVTPGVQ